MQIIQGYTVVVTQGLHTNVQKNASRSGHMLGCESMKLDGLPFFRI